MQFQIPQFIEREPKVIGPFTFRQFVYIAIPSAIAFFFYFTAPFIVFIVAGAVLESAGLALAFLKTGGRSLPQMLTSALQFGISPKIYIWKKERAQSETQIKTYVPAPVQEGEIPTKIVLIQQSKIKDLAKRIEHAHA